MIDRVIDEAEVRGQCGEGYFRPTSLERMDGFVFKDPPGVEALSVAVSSA